MIMHRTLGIILIASLSSFIFLIGFQSVASAAEKHRITIGTGGTGGTYYPSGGGVAELIRKKVDIVESATAEATAATVENTQLVNRGRADLGMVCWIGLRGQNMLGKDKIPNVRSMFYIHPSTAHWAVMADSDIYTFEDMKGKTLALDAPGSAGMESCKLLLKYFGIDPQKDVKAQWIKQGQGCEALKDGRVDAAFGDVGWPNSSFMDLATVRDVRILSFSKETLDKIQSKFPELPPEDIPAGTYSGQDETIHTYTETGGMICRADLPDDLVYQIVKVVHENQDWLKENVHTAIGRWSFDPSINEIVELHPGAKKYYKDIGLLD